MSVSHDDNHEGTTEDREDAAEVVTLNGHVKWFDPVKGYGFIVPAGGHTDVLLHMSCLRQSGHKITYEGATIEFEAQRRAKGLQATNILMLDNTTAVPEVVEQASAHETRPTREPVPQMRDDIPIEQGEVKWFNRIKGFGFLSVSGRTEDVFVHMEVLRRVNLQGLQPGDKVKVQVTEGNKGLQALTLELDH